MATLTRQQITLDGTAVTTASAASGGDKCLPGNTTWIEVTNASGSSINVTLNSVTPSNYGTDEDVVEAVADGTTKRIGPLNPTRFAGTSDGLASWTYSSHTGVTVAAVFI